MRIKKRDEHFIYDVPVVCNIKYYIKCVLMPILNCFYRCCIYLHKPVNIGTKKYTFVICSIFKNEAPFLREWIELNRLVGVDHFYLYNNFSSDSYLQILKPYIEKEIVTLIDWPISLGQFPAYNHFWQYYRDSTQWVSFIDIDEFFCPIIQIDIKEWIKQYENYPSVVVYWKMFGTSGKMKHDYNKLVTEQYTVCWDKLDSIGKVIVNTEWDFAEIYHHHIYAKFKIFNRSIKIPSINEFRKFIKWNQIHETKKNKNHSIQINHYWSKSFYSYMDAKVKRGDVNNHIRDLDLFYLHEQNNTSSDYAIFRFIVRLKLLFNE